MSARLPVSEGRFELSPLEPSANRHGSNFLITSHDLQLLPADGKWRLIVRPIQKAIIREQIVGLGLSRFTSLNCKDPSGLAGVASS